jgi:hypothetical protein
MHQNRNSLLFLLAASIIVLTGCSQEPQTLSMNPFLNKNAEEDSAYNASEVQDSYNQSIQNFYRAILGSTGTRELIIRNLTRLMMQARSSVTPDILQLHFTSFGYFNAPSRIGIKQFCQ